MIPAHDSPLAAIAFNPTGTRLATASERGTVIRIFSVQDGTRLMEFRRGVKRCAHVYSLAFSQESDLLALSSNTETIHIFKLDGSQAEGQGPVSPAVDHRQQQQPQQQQQQQQQDDGSWMGYSSKAVTASASYLPAQVTDTLNQSRAFATVTVPSAGLPNIVTIASLSRQTRSDLLSEALYDWTFSD